MMIVAALVAAGGVGGPAGVASHFLKRDAAPSHVAVAYADPIYGCSATDGDTIRCGDERIRLVGIDAPELPGHCQAGRDCAPGDPHASTNNLKAAMSGSLTIKRIGEDRYGRTLALVAGSEGDLSCWQLSHDRAIYKAHWDDGLNVARTCPSDVL
ncbi:thermonuclease family protein [Novosphingobium sp. RD2P27]|uniref:Thermonuclease family protein n=1 Tax=Novosphingobium kalidii TaxID=3230299 RepID=A0ABV2D3T8_9SPHN